MSRALAKLASIISPTVSPNDYDGAGNSRRTLMWRPSTAGPNTISATNAHDLIRRSRDMVRKGYGSAAVESHVTSLVGTGITPRPHGDDAFAEAVREAWADFVSQCDADGALDYYGMQSLAARARFEAGDVFLRYRPRRPEDGLTIPLQLQLIESEQCDYAYTRAFGNGRSIVNGIEFDRIGRRRAYHMWRNHPGDEQRFATNDQRVAVPASEVSHMYRPLRPGQVRGLPDLSPALLTLYDLDEVRDARIVREKIQNLLVGFITKLSDESNPLGGGSAGTDDDVPLAALEPGTMQELLPGENVMFSSPPSVTDGADEFFRTHLRLVAASLGITYEQLTGDLTDVNFSSIRAGLIEVRRRYEAMQSQVMVHQFCRPTYMRFVEAGMLAGVIPIPADFASRRMHYLTADWHSDAFEFVQPLDDVNTIIKKLRAGLMSRSQAIAELGYDAEAIDKQNAADAARADELELTYPELQGGTAPEVDADGDGLINEGGDA